MSSHGKTRLVCRVLRLRDAMTGSRASAHNEQCPDCQAYYRASDTLIGQLRQSAPRAQQPAPDELATRISRAVRQAAPQPRRSAPILWWMSSLSGALAVVALTFIVVRQNPMPPTISPRQNETPALRPAEIAAVVNEVDSLRTRFLTSVRPSAENLATNNPLTQELSSVQADARSALNFLALNFLPSDSVEQLESEREPSQT